MPNVHLLNKISKAGLSVLPEDWTITEDIDAADAILVRSHKMHDMTLSERTLAVARAGAGVNTIPLETYAEQGIIVFNTPGANANAVCELTLAGMFLAMRDIVGGINDVTARRDDPDLAKTVETIKGAYGGFEVRGKTLGIIGLGTIGMMVAKAARHLGMRVVATRRNLDAVREEAQASGLDLVGTPEEIYPIADIISLNLPLVDKTRHIVSDDAFRLMKDGVVILNFARAGLVDDDALERAIIAGQVRRYVTDFPNAKTANMDNVIAIPHLGASTAESEENCARMAAEQVRDLILKGTVRNAVTYPDIDVPDLGDRTRLLILMSDTDALDDVLRLTKPYESGHAVKGSYAVIWADGEKTAINALDDGIKGIRGVTRTRRIKG